MNKTLNTTEPKMNPAVYPQGYAGGIMHRNGDDIGEILSILQVRWAFGQCLSEKELRVGTTYMHLCPIATQSGGSWAFYFEVGSMQL